MTTYHNYPIHLLEQHPIILTTWCNAEALQRGTAYHQLEDDAKEGRDALIKCYFFLSLNFFLQSFMSQLFFGAVR